MKKLCVFDLDGTIVNSIEDIAFAANRGLRIMGLPEQPYDKFYTFVGNGMRKLCERALPSDCKDRVDELVKIYDKYYAEHCCVLTKPYDGIIDVINKLKSVGIKVAVLSNKPHSQTMNVVNNIFGEDYFDLVLGQTDGFPVKPNPGSLLYVIDKFGADKSDTVNIGDSDVDIILGKNAGIDSIGVSWGFRGKDELISAGAEAVADNAKELLDCILNY